MPDVTNAVAATGWGCPIAIYKKSSVTTPVPALTTWNKFTFYFSVPTFPTSSSNSAYQLVMKIGGSTGNKALVAWPSLASNLPTFPSGGRLSCTSVSGDSTKISCDNVGSLSAGTYWIALSISYAKSTLTSEISGIGSV